MRNGTERETAETIIAALERYGAIIVDRSAAPTMYAQRNADWKGVLPLNLLQDIPLPRFDVIDARPRSASTRPRAARRPRFSRPAPRGASPEPRAARQGATDFSTPETDSDQVVTP